MEFYQFGVNSLSTLLTFRTIESLLQKEMC